MSLRDIQSNKIVDVRQEDGRLVLVLPGDGTYGGISVDIGNSYEELQSNVQILMRENRTYELMALANIVASAGSLAGLTAAADAVGGRINDVDWRQSNPADVVNRRASP